MHSTLLIIILIIIIIIFCDESEGDQYLNWRVGYVFLCFSELPEDGTLVSKHVGVSTCHELYSILFYRVHLLVGVLNRTDNIDSMKLKSYMSHGYNFVICLRVNSENEVQLVIDGHLIFSKNLGVLCLAGYHGECPYTCLVI